MRALWRRADRGLDRVRSLLPDHSVRVPDAVLLVLFTLLLLPLSLGDRIGTSKATAEVLGSLHLVDLLFPLLGLAVLLHFDEVADGLGERLSLTLLAWVAFAFTLGQLGILLTGLWREPFAVFAGLAFAGKELEFVTLLAFGLLVGSRTPRWARNVVLAVGLFLAVWIVKELWAPSGYYYMGLPFATGAVQTGTVYALTSLALLGSLGRGRASADWERWALPVLGAILAVGVVLSGSRSSTLGLLAGAGVCGIQWIILGARSNGGKILLALGSIVVGIGLAMWIEPSAVSSSLDRWSSVLGGLEARLERWHGLLSILASKPWLIPFGAGLGTPDFLYFGREFGLTLMVDSGYVRRVFEVGIVGFTLYLFVLGQIATQGERYRATSSLPVLVAGIMAIALPMEAFQVSQAAGLFYTFAGLCLGRELIGEDAGAKEAADGGAGGPS